MAKLTAAQQAALYHARKRRRLASHSGPTYVGGVFSILMQDGSNSLVLEDMSYLLMEFDRHEITLENGSLLLCENGASIYME